MLRKSRQALHSLEKQEAKLQQRLPGLDSNQLNLLFAQSKSQYEQMLAGLDSTLTGDPGRMTGEYLPYVDSLKGFLGFLGANVRSLPAGKSAAVGMALLQFRQFQNRLKQADEIKQFIRERKQQLQALVSSYNSLPRSASKLIEKYNRQAYYYAAQIRQYRQLLNDPDRLLRQSLALLSRTPFFQQFMKDHSELGSLFSIPANYNSSLALVGMQTRGQVQQLISNQIGGSNPTQVLTQQLQAAQTQLDGFKQKIANLGGGSGDMDMPDFKPNTQRTKTFLQRIEVGANLQSAKSTLVFPSTTDISLMVGYRINDKSLAGFGLGGKLGWGRDIRHVELTGQGLNFRSFLDIRIKSSFYASGGLEYNYQKPYREFQQLYDLGDWTPSGLIGLSKIVSVKSKLFKKTRIQLLWDFLSSVNNHQQVSQPLKFRVGYTF